MRSSKNESELKNKKNSVFISSVCLDFRAKSRWKPHTNWAYGSRDIVILVDAQNNNLQRKLRAVIGCIYKSIIASSDSFSLIMCPLVVAFVSEVILFCKQNDIKKRCNVQYVGKSMLYPFHNNNLVPDGQNSIQRTDCWYLHKDTKIKCHSKINKLIWPMSQAGSQGETFGKFHKFMKGRSNLKQS